MGLKKIVVDALALGPASRGFTGGEARRWVREVFRHKTKDYGYTKRETNWAIRHGFMPEQVQKLGITNDNVDDYISARNYAFLRPLNGTYAKWLTDKATIDTVFKPYRKYMPKAYYHIIKRYNDTMFIPLDEDYQGREPEDVLDLIKEKEIVSIAPANGIEQSAIRFDGNRFILDHTKYSDTKMIEKLRSYNCSLIIRERIEPSDMVDKGVLNLIVFNEYGDNPVIGDAFMVFDEFERIPFADVKNQAGDSLEERDTLEEKFRNIRAEAVNEKTGEWRGKVIPHWDEIVSTIDSFCRFVPQLEFFGCEIIIREEDFVIASFENHPDYPTCKPFSKETSAYLMKKVEQKKEAYQSFGVRVKRGYNKLHLRVRKKFARAFYPADLVPYQSTRWISDVLKDFRTNKDASFAQKMWAYKRGYLSYRIKQYGITDENRNEFPADFEYKWLRHINPKYRKWMEDKITVKYVCSDHKDCFPEYYYHIICKNGNNKVISMMDLPEGYTNDFDEIFRLVSAKRVLALKPDEGSHGDGFYKFTCGTDEYGNARYQLNYKDASKEEILAILEDINNQYLVTEYIDMCDELKAVYDGSVNTVRMLVFKKDGVNPEIGNCYVRIGSKKTGAVDNVGAGGMTAHIDPETGHFCDAKIVINNEIVDCPIHPDTNVPIDGYLPHWNEVRQNVLDVARSIPQLEWFGFDLAVTNTGIKFPEINRFPDYPAVEKYSPKTRDYLMYKLSKKKEKYGYDKNPNNTLIHLPKR